MAFWLRLHHARRAVALMIERVVLDNVGVLALAAYVAVSQAWFVKSSRSGRQLVAFDIFWERFVKELVIVVTLELHATLALCRCDP